MSIGFPVYNGQSLARRALESLLAQEYEGFELIISDNASTDSTQSICEQFAARDSRVSYRRRAINLGAAWNFRHVLEAARGDYFMWAAHDDTWRPQFISTLLRDLEAHPDAGVALSAVQLLDEDGQRTNVIRFDGPKNPNGLSHYQMLTGLTLSGKAKRKYNLYIYGLFRTELLRQAMRAFIDTYIADRLLMCQIALAARFRYVDEILYERTVGARPSHQRYPEESFSRIFYGAHSLPRRVALDLGKMLWRSEIIPAHRKLYAPIAMWRIARLIETHLRKERKPENAIALSQAGPRHDG